MPNLSKELSEKDLQEVSIMSGLGMRFEDIAKIKGMCDDTLKKYAQSELEAGKAMAKQAVMQTAYQMAVSGKYPAMTMFWLKTQAQWRESQTLALDEGNLKALIEGNNKPTQIIIAFLAETMEMARQGVIAPNIANSVASVAGTFMKAVEQGDIEDRLAMLEAMSKTKDTKSIDIDLEL